MQDFSIRSRMRRTVLEHMISLHENTIFIKLIHNWLGVQDFSIPGRLPRTLPKRMKLIT